MHVETGIEYTTVYGLLSEADIDWQQPHENVDSAIN